MLDNSKIINFNLGNTLNDLNFEDTEEMPSSEDIDHCHLFDMDIETLPLF